MNKIKSLTAFFFSLLFILFAIGSGNKDSNSVTNNNELTFSEIENEETISDVSDNAKLVLTEFLNYYKSDWSEIEATGEQEISGQIYYTYKITEKDFVGYTYYVLINDNDESVYGGYPNSEMELLWFNGKPAYKEEFDSAPYIPYELDIIGDSFESYKNRVGGYFHDMTENNPTYCSDIKRYEGMS